MLAVAILTLVVLLSEAPLEVNQINKPEVDTFHLNQIDQQITQSENTFKDIKPGLKKSIIWNDRPGIRSEYAIVYVHGFSASLEELRPVPDLLAKALGANLFFTRLTGHARTPEAMIEGSIKTWVEDLDEAFKIGSAIGQKVIMIGCSTGGTLTAYGILNKNFSDQLYGVIFVSPNFGIRNKAAKFLTWPYAEYWLPIVAGKNQVNKPRNKLHEKYWTTSYPTISLIPMMELIEQTLETDTKYTDVPALFYFSPDDEVVNAQKTEFFINTWKGPKSIFRVSGESNEDQLNHLITGDAISPSQVKLASDVMNAWINSIAFSKPDTF